MRDSRAFVEMKEGLFSGYMLNPVLFFGCLSVVPSVDSAYKVAGNSADTLKLHTLAHHRFLLRIGHGIYPFVCLT